MLLLLLGQCTKEAWFCLAYFLRLLAPSLYQTTMEWLPMKRDCHTGCPPHLSTYVPMKYRMPHTSPQGPVELGSCFRQGKGWVRNDLEAFFVSYSLFDRCIRSLVFQVLQIILSSSHSNLTRERPSRGEVRPLKCRMVSQAHLTEGSNLHFLIPYSTHSKVRVGRRGYALVSNVMEKPTYVLAWEEDRV